MHPCLNPSFLLSPAVAAENESARSGNIVMNRLGAFAFCCLLVASTGAAQAPQKSSSTANKGDECIIAGTVVRLSGGEPLRKAKMTLQSVNDPADSISTFTDSGGHFDLKHLKPGGYKLRVTRVGFVTDEYGQRKPGDPGATLTLRPGQEINDLVFRLIPAGVIAGRILDEDGEPLPSVEVSALREVYTDGKRNLSTSAIVETNVLGEYRLFGLPPGRYFVSALYMQWNRFGDNGSEPADPVDASSQGYARMYYPGTPDTGKAEAIVVKTGEEIPSIEMLMRQVLVYHIRGHVFNQITHKPGVGTSLILVPKTAAGHEWEFSDLQASVQKPDGSFEIAEVLPAPYVLIAYWFDEGKIYSSRTALDISNADVEGLGVVIGAGTSINGRVIWNGQPALEKDELTVVPTSEDGHLTFAARTRVNQDNSFTLKEVGDGTYTVDVSGQSKDCYIKDVAYAGSSVLDNGFTVARGSAASLEITISSHGARVQGTVTDKDGLPAPGVWVVLVPDAHMSHHRLYKEQTTDQYGHFDLHGIAPGDYKLFSWHEVEQGAWEDPDFLKPFEQKSLGKKIIVQDSDTKSINIVAIDGQQ
jgi:hypothetical protein